MLYNILVNEKLSNDTNYRKGVINEEEVTNMGEKLLRIEEVALRINVSVKTIENWYAYKRMKPDEEYAKMLPEFIQNGERQTRYWKPSAVWQLIEFKNRIPKGRNGVLGCITQRYCKK